MLANLAPGNGQEGIFLFEAVAYFSWTRTCPGLMQWLILANRGCALAWITEVATYGAAWSKVYIRTSVTQGVADHVTTNKVTWLHHTMLTSHIVDGNRNENRAKQLVSKALAWIQKAMFCQPIRSLSFPYIVPLGGLTFPVDNMASILSGQYACLAQVFCNKLKNTHHRLSHVPHLSRQIVLNYDFVSVSTHHLQYIAR